MVDPWGLRTRPNSREVLATEQRQQQQSRSQVLSQLQRQTEMIHNLSNHVQNIETEKEHEREEMLEYIVGLHQRLEEFERKIHLEQNEEILDPIRLHQRHSFVRNTYDDDDCWKLNSFQLFILILTVTSFILALIGFIYRSETNNLLIRALNLRTLPNQSQQIDYS